MGLERMPSPGSSYTTLDPQLFHEPFKDPQIIDVESILPKNVIYNGMKDPCRIRTLI
jgi:hypothetical protein